MKAFIQDELKMELLKPITIGRNESAVVYTTLILREPTAGQLRIAMREGDELGVLMSLINQTSGVPMQVIERLSQRDIAEADDFFAQFASYSPTSLANSLPKSPSPIAGDHSTHGDSPDQS